MEIYFLKENKELIEKAIDLVTNGNHCHVELKFSDEQFFSSTVDTGPRFATFQQIDTQDLSLWDIIDLKATSEDEKIVRDLAEMVKHGIDGKSQTYSLKNIVLDFLPQPIVTQTPDEWICSQSVTYVLQSIGLFMGYVPQLLSPQLAFEIINSELLSWQTLRFEQMDKQGGINVS